MTPARMFQRFRCLDPPVSNLAECGCVARTPLGLHLGEGCGVRQLGLRQFPVHGRANYTGS
jgi:hypothetical protein